MRILSEKIMSTEQVESETDYVFCEVDKYGSKKYYNAEGQRHREDGPAVEYSNGDKEWFLNGKLHREDGPAKEFKANKYWYINDERHREDGPAIEYAYGDKSWYLNNKKVTEETVRMRKIEKWIALCLRSLRI